LASETVGFGRISKIVEKRKFVVVRRIEVVAPLDDCYDAGPARSDTATEGNETVAVGNLFERRE
jgi:hypothetical protein